MIAKILTKSLLILVAVLCALIALFGQEAVLADRANRPPVIDGVLEDSAWAKGVVWTGFKTTKPDFGLSPTENTEFLFSYDVHRLYFAFRRADSNHVKIKASYLWRF